jgi:hypothetical protein
LEQLVTTHPRLSGTENESPSPRPLIWLILLALVLLVLAYQVALPQRIDIGASKDNPFIHGFYFAENAGATTFRWSGPTGQVSLNAVGGRPWRLRLRASGLRPAGPAPVDVAINGQIVSTETWGGDMAEREYAISRDQAGFLGNVKLALTTTPFVVLPDQRQLGLQVDWVELQPTGWDLTMPPWIMLAGLLAAVILCYLTVLRVTRSPLWAFGAGALLIGLCVVGVVWFRVQVAVYLPWLLLGWVLLWAFSRRVRSAKWWEWLLFAGLALSAVRFQALVLDFLHGGAPMADFLVYFDAAKSLRLGGPLYDFAAAVGMPNGPVFKYPPFYAIVLAPFAIYPVQSVFTGWFLLNLVLLGVTGYLLAFRLWRPFAPVSVAPAYLIGIGILNFGPVWESLIRGQMDVVILTAAVVVLLLAQARKAELLAGALLALVTMLKLYPGLLVIYLLMQRRWRILAGFVVTSVALIVLSELVVGGTTLWRYVTEILAVQTAAVPWPENQSFDGLLSRLVIPAAQTDWYTTIPFPTWTKLTLYALDLIVLGVTYLVLWRGRSMGRRFILGYAVVMPLIVLMWPTAWIHYQALLLLPFAVLVFLQAEHRSWAAIGLILVSFLLIAVGNEYTVLTPPLSSGWPRLLQSYKLYGDLIMWALLLWSGRRLAQE